MFRLLSLIFVGYIISVLWGMEVIPERPIIEYFNPKYIKSVSINFFRQNRNSPHYVHVKIDTLSGLGNNVTVKVSVLEHLSAGYHPTPLQAEYKLCDFLLNEPYLGQMYYKQFPSNYTCPFKADHYELDDLIIHLEKFPFNIPFTRPFSTKARADADAYINTAKGKELLFKGKVHVTLIQKPSKKKSKNIKTKK